MDVVGAWALAGPGGEAAAAAAARARWLRGLAGDVRVLSQRVSRAAELDWRSAAADAFRSQAAEVARAVEELATGVERAADALDRHGAVVARRVAALEDALRSAPDRAWELGEGLAGRLADEVRRAADGPGS